MAGGGKGGSTTSKVEIPKWLEDAAQQNLSRADMISTIGYTPQYGPDVAALTPTQEAAMANTNAGASAFGMGAAPGTGMPAPQEFAGGVRGYSSAGLYEQALAELAARMPGQYAALREPFRDPVTGAMPIGPYGRAAAPAAATPAGGAGVWGSAIINAASGGNAPNFYGGGSGGGGSGGTGSFGLPDPASGRVTSVGGYTSLRDMFDGGGPGQSGSTFSGGLFSNTLNSLGVKPRS